MVSEQPEVLLPSLQVCREEGAFSLPCQAVALPLGFGCSGPLQLDQLTLLMSPLWEQKA